MNWIKKLGKTVLISFLFMCFITLLITCVHYFDIVSSSTVSILKFLTILSTFFLGGFLFGQKGKQKGYLEGIKFGVIFFLFFLIDCFLTKKNYPNVMYGIPLLLSSMVGGMLGIHFQKKEIE